MSEVMMKTGMVRNWVACGLLWGLTGCAALTIDVDVYKGPLSNDQDVQAEQTAVMAIGAKPMLIQLRNRLEESAMERFRESTRPKYYHHPDDRLPPLVERKGCGPFSPSSPISGFDQYWNDPLPSNYDFCDETAFRVNSILELYKDTREDDELTPLLQTVVKELKKLSEANRILAAKGDQYRAQLQRDWDRLTADSLRKYEDKGKEFNGQLAALVKGFGTFLKGTGKEEGMYYSRDPKFLEVSRPSIVGYFKENEKRSLADIMKSRWSGKKKFANWQEKPPEYGYTYWYLALENEEIVKNYADLIFDENFSSNKKEFVQWVTQTAQSFTAAEKSLRALLRADLKIILALEKSGKENWKDKYLATVVSIASKLISKRRFDEAVRQVGSEAATRANIWIINDLKEFNDLKNAIKENPVQTATFLLKLDEVYSTVASEGQLNSIFGIATGPTSFEERGEKANLESVINAYNENSKLFAAGSLQGGRLNDGIETLLEEYLNLAHNQPQNSALQEDHGKKVEVKKDQLFKALARFAQKVLFISNYHRLFTVGTPDDTTLKYVDGLQAVGNSIISQVDEHNKRTRFENRVKATTLNPESARKEAQALAFGMALSEDPERVRKRIIEALEAKKFPQNRFKQIAEEIQTLKNKIQAAKNSHAEQKLILEGSEKRIDELNPELVSTETQASRWKGVSIGFKFNSGHPWHSGINKINEAKEGGEDKKYTQEEYLKAIGTELKNNEGIKDTEVFKFLLEETNQVKLKLTNDSNDKKPGATIMVLIQEKAQELFESEDKRAKGKKAELATLGSKKDMANAKIAHVKNEVERIQLKLVEKEQELEGLKAKVEEPAKLKDAIDILKEVETNLKNGLKPGSAEALYTALTTLDQAGLLAQVEEALKAESGPKEMSNVNPNDYVVALEATRAIDSFKRLKKEFKKDGELLYDARNAKEVMETVVSALEYEYVAVVRDQGQNTPGARHLARAIKQAKEKVNRTKYIRPAADYLRSSFPSTALQVDPKIGWKNMLRNNGIRSILGDGLSDEQKERAKLKIDIDKQFWQNINRVHVSGAGDTNYVIIKDDVGNWVVKNYSASPEVIIQSAKGLALFGMGGGMGANLLGRSGIFESAETSPAEKLTTEQNKSLMERKLDSSTEDFQKASKADAEAAIKLAKSIVTDVQSKWNKTGFPGGTSGRQELEGVLTGTGTAQLADARKDLPENPDSAKEFRDRVAAIKKFYDAAKSKMKKLASDQKNSDQSGNETQKANQEEAIQTFTEVVGEKLLALINQREATMAKYDGTLTFLTDLLSE